MIILVGAVPVVVLAALIVRARVSPGAREAVVRWCRVACLPLWLVGTVFAAWSSWDTSSPGRLVGVLTIPTALCLAGSLLPAGRFHGAAAWTLVGLLLLFVTVAGFSVGLYYLPAALVLLAAAALGGPDEVMRGRPRGSRARLKGG